MIGSIRHKGLRKLYQDDDASALSAEHLDKLRVILARLDAAKSPDDMDLPGLRLHPLKGRLKGSYAVTVRANWRVTFRFQAGVPLDVDLVDYH